MSFDPLAALREAGSPVEQLSEAQRTVLASLEDYEVEVLVSVQQRLRDVHDSDLEGHEMKLL